MTAHCPACREPIDWTDGRWEQRGNVWVYIEGGWH